MSGARAGRRQESSGARVNNNWLVAAVAMRAAQQALGAIVLGALARRGRMSDAALATEALDHGGLYLGPRRRLPPRPGAR